MYAIVEIAGLQYKVEKDQRLYVNRLNVEAGKKVKFDRVLLIEEKGDVKVGAPVIDGAKVDATVNGEVKGDKILVFKKKRRKGYQKMNGHRQIFTSITINKITAKAQLKKLQQKQLKKRKLLLKRLQLKSQQLKQLLLRNQQQRNQLLKRQPLRNQQLKKQINKKLWLTRKV